MSDVIEIGKVFLNAGATTALLGFLTVLAVPSLKKKVFGNGHDEQAKIINDRLDIFEGNHLHTIEELVKTMKEETAGFKKIMEEHNREELKLLDKILLNIEK